MKATLYTPGLNRSLAENKILQALFYSQSK